MEGALHHPTPPKQDHPSTGSGTALVGKGYEGVRVQWLSGVKVHESTRAMHTTGLYRRVARKTPLFNYSDIKACLEFARKD